MNSDILRSVVAELMDLCRDTAEGKELVSKSLMVVMEKLNEDLGIYYSIEEVPDLPMVVFGLIAPFCSARGKRLFPKLYERIGDNLEAQHFVTPDKYKGDRVVLDYLKGTPLIKLMRLQISLRIPWETLFSHMHVIGGSGSGKTQWLAQHFLRVCGVSVVVVDSQGDLIPKIARLKALRDRLILIDPRNPPSIRLFGEGSFEIFDYLFNGILGADLTAKQSIFFRMMVKLLQSIPGATILDMFRMMQDITPYKKYVQALPDLQREFFETDFNSRTFSQTKEQVRYRLNALLENESLHTLLTEQADPLDLERALNDGAIILIDTSKEYLKGSSPAFGRIFIALILQAIYNRASQKDRQDTFLLIDEAQEYFDQNIDDLLTQVRKYRCGLVLAHQYLGQCSPQLRESLAANTAIKMVSGVSVPDARALAQELRTTPEFILAQKPLHFATFVRNETEKAVSIEVSPGLLERQEQLDIPTHTPPPKRIHTPTNKDEPPTDASQTW